MSCSPGGWRAFALGVISWPLKPARRKATGDRGIGRAVDRTIDRSITRTIDRSIAASATPAYSVETVSSVLHFQPGCVQPARLVRHYRFISAEGPPPGDRVGRETHGRARRDRRTSHNSAALARP